MSRSRLADTALALALLLVGIVGTTGADWNNDAERPIDAIGYALVVVTALVLTVRRRWPVATLGVATLLTSAYLIVGYTYGPILFAFAVAVYTVARYRPIARSAPISAGAVVVVVIHVFTNDAALPSFVGLAFGSAWVTAPFALGVVVRVSREAVTRARAEVIRQHVDEERLRVAQDVHDTVGHGLTAIKMQADVALHLLDRKPEQAQTALESISRTSGQALDELRSTLAVVRRTGAAGERSPIPGLAQLPELRQRVNGAGVHVQMETVGEPRHLPTVIDHTCYRVIQEALTNALRHSAAKVATVRVDYQTDTVAITVSNPVTPTPSHGSSESAWDQGAELSDGAGWTGGLGIAGMRERVTAVGGTFSVHHADGHFEVHATIPTGAQQ